MPLSGCRRSGCVTRLVMSRVRRWVWRRRRGENGRPYDRLPPSGSLRMVPVDARLVPARHFQRVGSIYASLSSSTCCMLYVVCWIHIIWRGRNADGCALCLVLSHVYTIVNRWYKERYDHTMAICTIRTCICKERCDRTMNVCIYNTNTLTTYITILHVLRRGRAHHLI